MSITAIENYNPENWFYALRDKMWGHVAGRSEECFKKAEEARKEIKSIDDLKKYAEEKRSFFIDCLGGIPYDKGLPLNARVTGVIEEPGLRIEKIVFESRPKVYVTANLYIPEKRKNPCGAVVFQCGHTADGKCDSEYQRVVRAIASCGVIVLVYDPVGQGERLSYYEPSLGKPLVAATTWEHMYAGEQCVLTGNNIARYFIADAMRAVDYLISRPEVDSGKIGATGNSGGGTATCHLMMCDPRIQAAAPGTFVTTRRAYLYAGGAQDSEQIWFGATENGFDHHELFMCFAPKPLLLLGVDTDFFPIEGAEEVINISKRFWKMYSKEGKLNMVTDRSQHKYTDTLGCRTGEFFAFELNGEKRTAEKASLKSISAQKLWCTERGQVKLDFPDSRFVYEENLEQYKNSKKNEKSLKEFLLKSIEHKRIPLPLRLRTFSEMYERNLKIIPYLWFAQSQMPNWGLLFSQFDKKPSEVVICLWNSGTDDIDGHIYLIRKICREGKAAFVIDLSAMGKCVPHGLNTGWTDKAQYGVIDRLTKDLFFLGDSLCALRLFELRYVADVVCKELGLKPSIYAEGICAAYARLYKELDSLIETTLHEPMPEYNELVEEKYYADYNIAEVLLPGIARYYKEA